MRFKLFTVTILALIIIAGCGNDSNEEGLEITDETELEATEQVEQFLSEIYKNKEFSSIESIDGLKFLNGDAFKEGLAAELEYVTSGSDFEIDQVIVKEIIEPPNYPNSDDYEHVYIVNSDIVYAEENEANRHYTKSGNVIAYDDETESWEILWYNLGEYLVQDGDYIRVEPNNTDEKEVVRIAKQLVEGFFSFDTKETPEDTLGLEDLWREEDKELFTENLLITNESFLSTYPNVEDRPSVLEAVPVELLKFNHSPYDDIEEAYAVVIDIVYDQSRTSIDVDETTVFVGKIDGEWKVFRHSVGRETPWSFGEVETEQDEETNHDETDSSVINFETDNGILLQMTPEQRINLNDADLDNILAELSGLGHPDKDQVSFYVSGIYFDHENEILRVELFIRNGFDFTVQLTNTDFKISVEDSETAEHIDVAQAYFDLSNIEPLQPGYSRVEVFTYDSNFFNDITYEIDWDDVWYYYEWYVNYDY